MHGWPLVKIISGAQTGADQAGLRAGKALGYVTGGTMPHNFLTEDGLHPEFASLYSVVELSNGSYSERTRANVIDSDGTIWFGDPTSPGGVLTLKYCRLFKKPRLVLTLVAPQVDYAIEVQQWVRSYHIKVVNIAGNRESKTPGIGAAVEALLVEALRR
jgi:hypothetical protein